MTDRVTVGNLRVAKVLYDFVTNEALPGTGSGPRQLLGGRRQGRRRSDAARTRTCWPAATTCRRRSTSGTASASSSRSTPTAYQAVPHRDRLPAARARRLHHHHRPASTTRSPRTAGPAARGARSSTRGSRSTPPTPAGVRCTTRCTAPTSSPRPTAPRRARQLQPGARRQGHRLRPRVPRRGRAAGVRLVGRRHRPQRRRRPAAGHARPTDCRSAWPARRSSSATPASSARRRGRCCWSTTACTSRS